MRTLKITAHWNNPKPKRVRNCSEIPYLETDKSPWWYLHGELQEITGSDKAVATNIKSGGFSMDTIDWEEIIDDQVKSVGTEDPIPVMHIEGIVPVKIDGIKRKCLGYFWVDDVKTIFWKNQEYPFWKQRGVVVLKDNEDDVKYAENLFEERPKIF